MAKTAFGGTATAMKILIIDDEADMRSVVAGILETIGGLEAIMADGGAAGLALAKAQRPDAILLDLMMPGMDGLETLGHLKADAVTADIPVIMFTAQGVIDDLAYTQAGAVAVFEKPFDPDDLISAVQRLSGSSACR
jgi:CheY-like chemotaxis protein